MARCIVKTAPEYKGLKDRVQSELLADAILNNWWKHKENEDRYPDENYISKFLNKIGAVHFDDDGNDYFYDEDNSDESKFDFSDDLATMDSEKATQEEIDAKEYHGTGTVLSPPLKLDIDQAREEIAKVATERFVGGGKYRQTGMTSRLGEEYDPMNGPIKRDPGNKFTHAGSAIHEMLDDAVKMILDNPKDFEESATGTISDRLKAKKKEGGYSHYDLVNISDDAIDKIASTISGLRWKYDFVSSEIPLSGIDATDRPFNCAIDLVVRDKETGAIGLLDYKTQTEKGEGESKFNLYHKLKTPAGTSKYDNLQIQTLTYKSLLNDKYKQATGNTNDIVNFRGFIPISIEMDKDGNVSSANVADINNAERVGSVYYLKDTSSYRNTVAEKFGLGADDIHKAQAFENKMAELKEVVQSAAEHYARKSGKSIMKDVLDPLSGFNIMSDMPSIIKASKEFCKKTTTILNNRPEDVDNIYRSQVAWQSMSDVAGSLTQHVEDGFLDNYVASIVEVPQQQKERYTQDLRNAIADYVNDVNNLKESIGTARRRELMTHRDEFRQVAFEHNVLKNLREQAFKDIKAELAEKNQLDKFTKEDYWQEATDRAMQWYENNPTVYDNKVNNVIDKMLYLSGHNELSTSFAKRWLSPISNTTNPFVGYLVKTIDDGNSKVAIESRSDRRAIESVVKDLHRLVGKGKAKDVYGFMFDWRDAGDGKKAARIVTEFKDRELDSAKFKLNDIVKRLGNWNEDDMSFLREHIGDETLEHVASGEYMSDAQVKYLLYKGFKDNNYSLKEGLTLSQANRHTRNSILEGLKDLAYKGFISDADLRTAKTHLRSMDEMVLPKAFSKSEGEDAPWKQYARELYYQHQYEVMTPTDKWRNGKHDFIRSLDDNDPRKKFYNLYKEITSEYDKYADDTKKIHDNLPSLLDNHGSGFFRRDRISQEYNKNKRGIKGWFDTCENQEQHARIPLPFTGYQLDPDRQNYDLGLGLFKLKDSLNNYKEFSSRVAGIELMYDHLADNTGFTKDGAFKKAEDDELVRLRKYIDRALYKSSKDPKWIKAVNSLLSVFSIRALAGNPLVALNSHYMSAATLRALGVGKDGIATHTGFSKAWLNFSKNALMGKPVAEFVSRDAVTKSGRIMQMLGMYDSKYKYERFGGNNAFRVNNKAQLKDEIINQSFSLLRTTDATHRSIWTEAICRSLQVYDNEGKHLGSLYDNLVEDKNTARPSDKIAYTDKNRTHKFDINEVRREAQQLISRTTQPQSDIDRPVMSFSALGRTTSMFRNIGLNFWSSAMTRDRVNPLTGKEEVGFVANLHNDGAIWGSIGELGLGPAKVKNFTEAFQKYMIRPIAKYCGSETAQTWGSDIAGKNLTPAQKKACQQLGSYATIYTLALIAKNSLLNGRLSLFQNEDDKEERKELFNNQHPILSNEWLRLLGARLCLGVMASLNPVDFFSGMNPGGVMVSTGKDVYNFLKQLVEDGMSESSKYKRNTGRGYIDLSEYESGVHEGEKKLYRKFLKATGVGNIPDRIKNIQNTVKYLNEQ